MFVVKNGNDGHLHYVEVPNPSPAPDQVLVKVHAAALNRADLLQRAGQYPPPPGWPDWFGLEAAGEIVEMGAQAAREGRWRIGDKVCALLGGGGYAQYVAVPEGMLMPIPKGLSMVKPRRCRRFSARRICFFSSKESSRPAMRCSYRPAQAAWPAC